MKLNFLRASSLVWAGLLMLGTGGVPGGEIASRLGGERLKYEEPISLEGSIYVADGQRLLFKFRRVANRSDSKLQVQRDFNYPDGTLAARERVLYDGDELVLYELNEVQIGAAGSAIIRRRTDKSAGRIDFEYTPAAGGRPKTRSEALRENTLMADMVGPFLAAHWQELSRGETVKCRYLVVPRRETVGFSFAKDSETTFQGQGVLILRMAVSSPLLAPLISPLFFTIEKAPPHHVLRYAGRTTPKLRVGDKWKDLDAVTVFDWQSAR